MVKFIRFTSSRDNKDLYINPETIGHIYSEKETGNWGGEMKDRVITVIGTTCHNNGGFKVLESVEDVLKVINLFYNNVRVIP